MHYKPAEKNELIKLLDKFSELSDPYFAKLIGYASSNSSRGRSIKKMRERSTITLHRLLEIYELTKKMNIDPPLNIEEMINAADEITNGSPVSKIGKDIIIDYLYKNPN